jgi:hypothetical protein
MHRRSESRLLYDTTTMSTPATSRPYQYTASIEDRVGRGVIRALALIGTAAVLLVVGLPGHVHAAGSAKIWAVEVTKRTAAAATPAEAARWKAAGITALIVDPSRVTRAEGAGLRAAATESGLRVITPLRQPRGGPTAVASACRSWRLAHGGDPCAVLASSSAGATMLSKTHASDLVVVRQPMPAALATGGRTPVLTVADLGSSFSAAAWALAIGRTEAGAALDLAAGLESSSRLPNLTRYLQLLSTERARHGEVAKALGGPPAPLPASSDHSPPNVPDNQHVTQRTRTLIAMSWNASTDNVGVTGYALYINRVWVANTAGTSFAYTGLRCGIKYRVGLVAYDAAGNVSSILGAEGPVKTSACPPSTKKPVKKVQPKKPVTKPQPAKPAPLPPPLSTAPASVFLSPSGSDSSPCTKGAPCATISRAYQVSRLGAVVELAGGTYSSGTISGPSKTGAGVVTFRPAAGAAVTVTGELRTTGQDHLNFESIAFTGGIYISGSSNADGSDDVTFRTSSIRTLFVRNGDGFNLVGGDVGGTCDGTSGTIGSGDSAFRVSHVLIDGVRFHDITRACNPTSHVECLFVQELSYLTIQNSTFANCDIMDIFFHAIGGGHDPDHVVLKGNHFGKTGGDGSYDIIFRADSGEALDDYLVQGNTFSQPIYVENAPGSSVTSFRVCSNAGDRVSTQTNTQGFRKSC